MRAQRRETTRRPRRGLAAVAAVALLASGVAALAAPAAAQAVPREFFGIGPQTHLTEVDTERMRVARIGSVRWPVEWRGVQPTPNGGYHWGSIDHVVRVAARQRLRVLPFIYGTPRWLSPNWRTLPVNNARQRRAWAAFLRAAVERYGPSGAFWREHNRASGDFVPKIPLMDWQIWNEANFFYFARPASPPRYGRLLKLSKRAMRRGDRRVRTIASGLFGAPTARPPRAMHSAAFLHRLYRVRGIKAAMDGIALHPYAEDAATMRRMTERLRRIAVRNRHARVRLYVTEFGWGSDNNPNLVSFEQGVRFQLREMRRAYRYLIRNRGRLNLKGTHWFTWKDVQGACNFCDSTGLFRKGDRLRPKPAWRAFVNITGGRARP